MSPLWRSMVVLLSLFAVPAAAAQDRVRYKLEEGTVRFQCTGEGLAVPAWGKFSAVSSAVLFDSKRPNATRGDVHVLLSSIVSEDVWWDKMFRGAAFLELEDFPKSSFKLKKLYGDKPLRPNKWTFLNADGLFTLHGVSREMRVPVAVRWTPADPVKKSPATLAVHTSMSIRWRDYEIRVPPGNTRKFTGDGADVQVHLRYVEASTIKDKKGG